jgi:DNA-3-methyladenine glycosylase I
MALARCPWATSPEMIRYHDDEWGRPSHGERHLFEMLVLEGAQAGLSWLTILRKRDAYRRAFADFDPARVSRMTKRTVEKLMRDPGIVRNQAKVESAIANARAIAKIAVEFGTFDRFIWGFVGGKPIVNAWRTTKQIPASTRLSEAMSAELRKRGFRFVGPTICYAFMQAVGMVNDHLVECAWHDRVAG